MREEYDREMFQAMLDLEWADQGYCSLEAEPSGGAAAGETVHATSEPVVGIHSYCVAVDDAAGLMGHEAGEDMRVEVRLGRGERAVGL